MIRRLLLKELKDTDALLFDVRDNADGDFEYAQSLVQFFKGSSSHIKFSILKNNIMEKYVQKGNKDSE